MYTTNIHAWYFSTALWVFMANSLLISLLQIYLLFLSFSTCALGLAEFHVVDLRDLTSKNVCSPPKDMERFKAVKPTLKIVDRQGPCSTLHPAKKLSLEQILSNDQSRVDSIHRRVSAIAGKGTTLGPLSSQITAQYGISYGVSNYIVHVGIGTPSKTLTLEFDTGRDVTWVQCKPCQTYCHKQQDPIFDPSQSSTFMNVSCNSTPCNAVSGNACSGSSCLYGVQYGDQSYTVGYYAEDTLTLTPDMIQKFRFGCGQNNQGSQFGEVAGLLGLGRSSESFVSQTSNKYQRIFQYCLPPVSSSTGYLKFGSNSDTSNKNRIPIKPGSYYYITMTGLSVAGKTLPINPTVFSNAGTIIDSGTVITRLPPDAYQALRSAFREHMTQYKMAENISTLLDTCYNFTGSHNVTIPTVSVQFENNVSLNLVPNGIMFTIPNSQLACLAFAGNRNARSVVIYGNVQQRTFNVVYDIPKGEIGFSPGAC